MSELLVRAFEASTLEMRDDGRTVEGRIVPYNEVALVVDDGEAYEEVFLPGALTMSVQTAKRRGNAGWIALNIEHDHGLRSRIGYATAIRQDDAGGYASFRLYDSDDLTKVRSMLAESHGGLSVGFRDIARPKVLDGGIVGRVQVHVDHVAATPVPCYAGAAITAVRDFDGPLPTPDLDAVKAYLASRGNGPPTGAGGEDS